MVFVETLPIVHEIMLHQPSFCRSHCRRRQRGRGWGWPTFHAVCTNHSHECHKQHVGYFDIACFFSLAGRYMFQNAAKLCICGDLLILAMNDAFHTKHVPYNSWVPAIPPPYCRLRLACVRFCTPSLKGLFAHYWMKPDSQNTLAQMTWCRKCGNAETPIPAVFRSDMENNWTDYSIY